MSDCGDDDFLATKRIDDAVRETTEKELSEGAPRRRTDSRALKKHLDRTVHIVEKRSSQSRHPRLFRTRRLRSALPSPREDSDARSLQALARFGHYLITGNRLDFASEIPGLSALSFLDPRFLDFRILSRV